MRGRLAHFIAVSLVLAAGCGDEEGSAPPIDDPTTPSTVSTTEPASPAPTPPATTTPIAPATSEMVLLRPDGLGPVDFGTPADDAVDALTTVLGEPDRVEPVEPGGECVEGASWLDCVSGRIVERGRLAVWSSSGLEVAFLDTGLRDWTGERTPLQLGDWHATAAPGDVRVVTPEGAFAGMTVGALRDATPSVEFTYNEGLLDSFFLDADGAGGYWGRLDWDPTTSEIDGHDVATIQEALNDHGADLQVDGVWGPASQAAWQAFLTELGLQPPAAAPDWPLLIDPGVALALGLPPDDVVVATLEPRPAIDSVDLGVPASPVTLRPDGLGPVDFGTATEVALPALVELLGPPDSDITSTEPECTLAIERARTVVWESTGLHVTFTDWPGNIGLPPAPSHLASWSVWFAPPRSVALATAEGIGTGSTARDVRSIPTSSPMIPDVGRWGFEIAAPSGSVSGDIGWSEQLPFYLLDESFVRELQRALNRHGADLAVDGIAGPRTMQALTDFAARQGVGGFALTPMWDSIELTPEVLEVFWLLELPPDDAPVTHMWAGDPSTCG